MSYEWYFTSKAGHTGYLSAAYYYKDLETYIYYANQLHDFVGEPVPPPGSSDIPGVNYPTSTVGLLNQPINGTGGYMEGYELTASVPLDALWEPLEGFGIQATYSSNHSNIEPYPGSNEPIPGLSEDVWNATAFWERYGWSLRYNIRHRSEYQCESREFGADLGVSACLEETVQDAQIQYTFTSGALENLSFYLQMTNLTDEPFKKGTVPDRPGRFEEYGRQTLLGVSYKF
jgi:iron complex outermembrane receptor protein